MNTIHSVSCRLSDSDRVRRHLGPLSSLPSDSKNSIRPRGGCNGNLSYCRGNFSSTRWCLRRSEGAKERVRGGAVGFCEPKHHGLGFLQTFARGGGPPGGRDGRRCGYGCVSVHG